jgi:hypothetical protein
VQLCKQMHTIRSKQLHQYMDSIYVHVWLLSC